MIEPQPKEKQCKDCPSTFVLTPEAQKFFISKGLKEPVRCPPCRTKKKERDAAGVRPTDRKAPQPAPKSYKPKPQTDKEQFGIPRKKEDTIDPHSIGSNGERRWSFGS